MTKTKSVLYISYDGMTDPLGQSQVLPYLKGISAEGYKFYILSYEKPDLYEKKKHIIEEFIGDSDIVWLPQKYHKNPPVLSGIYDFLKGMLLAYYYILTKGIKIVHCRGAYITSLMGFLPIITLNLKYIFDMRGFYADERADAKIWNRSSLLYNLIYSFFKKFEKIALKRANVTITLTYAAKTWIEDFYKLNKHIDVIPCCADENVYMKKDNTVREAYRAKLGLKEEFVLVYLGSLGSWYMLDEMLDFYCVLKSKKTDAKFIFITNEPVNNIYNLSDKKNIKREDLIIFSAERKEISSYLSIADATIFFILPMFSKKGSSPVKHAEVLLSHLPLICNNLVGDVEQIVNESNTGFVVKEFNTINYENAIIYIDKLIKKLEDSKYNEAYNKYYSLEKGVSLYKEIYHKLI